MWRRKATGNQLEKWLDDRTCSGSSRQLGMRKKRRSYVNKARLSVSFRNIRTVQASRSNLTIYVCLAQTDLYANLICPGARPVNHTGD